jgi:hypothetical protein
MVDRQNQPAAWRRALESRRVTKAARRDKQGKSRDASVTPRALGVLTSAVGLGQSAPMSPTCLPACAPPSTM